MAVSMDDAEPAAVVFGVDDLGSHGRWTAIRDVNEPGTAMSRHRPVAGLAAFGSVNPQIRPTYFVAAGAADSLAA